MAILRVDDPGFDLPSRGSMQALLGDTSAWRLSHNSSFHTGMFETIAMMHGVCVNISAGQKLMWTDGRGLQSFLTDVHAHGWVGAIE